MVATSVKRRLLLGSSAALGAAALVLTGAVAASAHVSIAEGPVEAGSYMVLTFGVPHGCEGSSTTELAIQIPAGVNAVTPTRNALYTVETVKEALDSPIKDSHGNEVTERISQVVYTATTPLPDAQRDALQLSLQIPQDAAGTTLYFPTVQSCEKGETAWVQIPAEGQDAHELDAPAPSVDVIAAGGESGHGHGSDTNASTGTEKSDETATQTPLIVTSLAIGSVGLVVAAFALLRGRRKA